MVKRWLWAYSYLATAHSAGLIIGLAAAREHSPHYKRNGEGEGDRFSHGSRFPGRRKSYHNEQTRPVQH